MLRRIVRSCLPPLALLATAAAEQPVRYGRDVRPILADRCFRCHGPDAGTREANLRLDEQQAAIAPRRDAAAIVPFDPAASLLWCRVCAVDVDERMPPLRSGKAPLSPTELNTLSAWILAGADYEPHWAFVPPQRPPVPATSIASANAIDHFIAERLQRTGRSLSPEADRD